MKIAVLSDIHGNAPALERVVEDIARWDPDEVIVNGDLLSRGPCSLEVMQLVERELPHARLLQGNHEAFLLHCAASPADPQSPTYEMERFAHWSVAQLGAALQRVVGWGDAFDQEGEEGSSLHITHGSRLGNRKGIQPEADAEELAEKIGAPRDLFIGSHTHRPFTRRHAATLVVNTGSVGQPFDGDPRASYARAEFRGGRWRVEILRLDYDRQRAMDDFHTSGFLEAGGPFAELIFKEFCEARMHVGPWRRRYLEAIKRGEISVVAAIRDYLERLA